jgi:hypothetical protein
MMSHLNVIGRMPVLLIDQVSGRIITSTSLLGLFPLGPSSSLPLAHLGEHWGGGAAGT